MRGAVRNQEDLDALMVRMGGEVGKDGRPPSTAQSTQHVASLVSWRGQARFVATQRSGAQSIFATKLRRRGVPPLPASLAARLGVGLLAAPSFQCSGETEIVSTRLHDLVEKLKANWSNSVEDIILSVRPTSGNHKPTFVAFDVAGAELGYGKIAFNDVTRHMIEGEVQAREVLPRSGLSSVRVPQTLGDLEWGDHRVLITEPMPSDARILRKSPAPLDFVRDVLQHAAIARPAETVVRAMTEQVESCPASALIESTHQAVDRLELYGLGYEVLTGPMHGDWVPWNLARTKHGELWAFDWEHFRANGSFLLDIALFYLLSNLYVRKLAPIHALSSAMTSATVALSQLQVDVQTVRSTLSLLPLHFASRVSGQISRGENVGEVEVAVALLNSPLSTALDRRR